MSFQEVIKLLTFLYWPWHFSAPLHICINMVPWILLHQIFRNLSQFTEVSDSTEGNAAETNSTVRSFFFSISRLVTNLYAFPEQAEDLLPGAQTSQTFTFSLTLRNWGQASYPAYFLDCFMHFFSLYWYIWCEKITGYGHSIHSNHHSYYSYSRSLHIRGDWPSKYFNVTVPDATRTSSVKVIWICFSEDICISHLDFVIYFLLIVLFYQFLSWKLCPVPPLDCRLHFTRP